MVEEDFGNCEGHAFKRYGHGKPFQAKTHRSTIRLRGFAQTTPEPQTGGGGAHSGERAPHASERPYIGVKGHTEAKEPHAGKGPMKVKGPQR